MKRLFGVLLLGVLAGCAGGETDSDVLDTGGFVLEDDAYRFCHDTDRPTPLDTWEKATYCPLLDEVEAGTCPGLERSCAEEPEDLPPIPPSGCGGGGAAPPAGGGGGSGELAEPPSPPPEPFELEFSEALGEILRWTVAFFVALLLAGVLFAAVRLLLKYLQNRRETPTQEVPAKAEVAPLDVPDADAVPLAPSNDLLDAARRAIEEGRLADAVLFCRGAALRALGDAGHVRLHVSRTDREYVRALRRTAPERQGPLRTVIRAVELVRWGGRPITADDARAALAAAVQIVAVLVVMLGVFAARPAHAQERDPYGADGDAALLEVFADAGFDARWRLRTLRSVDADTHLLVVNAQDTWMDPEDGAALRSWVEDGGVLILAGDDGAFPELGHVSDFRGEDVRVIREARRLGLEAPVALGGGIVPYEEAHGEPWVSVTDRSGERQVVLQRVVVGEGEVIGLSDARYLTNGALIVPANVLFLQSAAHVALAESERVAPEEGARLEIATIAGPGSGGGASGENPLASLANARLLPFVLQLLALLALIGLWRGVPFGPLRDPPAEGRIRFSDHARALGRRFARSGASRHVASAQARLCSCTSLA